MTITNYMQRLKIFLAALLLVFAGGTAARAQIDIWNNQIEIQKKDSRGNTTIISRSKSDGESKIKLIALLTADGQLIDRGLIWRVFTPPAGNAQPKLIKEFREASPEIDLPAGTYSINVSFGRAHITRQIKVDETTSATEQFVLNAGGLRLTALHNNKPAPPGTVTYAIYSDDQDGYSPRTVIMAAAKPGLIIRLNAGIYRIKSHFGNANATVEADVTVEAGKLTETTVTHAAGRAMFKLVNREGGEAIPGTSWSIVNKSGKAIQNSYGALPSHYFSPGSYVVAAKSAGQVYRRTFEIEDGKSTTVELVRGNTTGSTTPAAQGGTDPVDLFNLNGQTLKPSFDIKSP